MVGLACVSTVVQILWLSRFKKSKSGVGDLCVWVAFVVGIVLVAQTTWAIIDEGSGKHQSDIAQQSLAAIAKVCCLIASAVRLLTILQSLIINNLNLAQAMNAFLVYIPHKCQGRIFLRSVGDSIVSHDEIDIANQVMF